MRKTGLLLLTAGLLVACSQESISPALDTGDLTSFALNGGFAYGMPGGLPGRGTPELRRLNMLPDSLALTSAQEAQINELIEAFQTTNKSDLDSLTAIMKQVHDA